MFRSIRDDCGANLRLGKFRRLIGHPRLSARRCGAGAGRHAVDEGIDRGAERRIAVESLEGGDESARRRVSKRVERGELYLVIVADPTQKSLGLRQGVAEQKGVERKPETSRVGIGESGPAERPVNHLARGMIGRSRRMETEMQMEQARVALGEVAVRRGDAAKI